MPLPDTEGNRKLAIVTAALSQKAEVLKKQLAALGSDYAEVGRIAFYGRRKSLCRGVATCTPAPETAKGPASSP